MTWPVGYDRRVYDTLDSTLNEAARLAPDLRAPVWLLAHHQTAARGRRGRPWQAPPGNLSATLVLPVSDPPAICALRSFVASLALYDACVASTGQSAGLSLKWPNDVLLNGGKLAGILLENAGSAQVLAIGIGVNLAHAPPADAVEPGAIRPVSLAKETGTQPEPEAFLEALAAAYAEWETQFRQFGFAPVRTAWLDRAARLGEVITARTGQASYVGRFDSIGSDGALELCAQDGPVRLAAADIYF